jgi:hypothetical protein
MIRLTRLLWILLLAGILPEASAQNSQVLYYMNLPQNHLLNPAIKPFNSVYIGLPGLTGINLNVNNNFINFSDVFMKGQQPSDSIITFLHPDFDIDGFLSKIKDKNSIEPLAAVQLFGLGFTVGKDLYLFLDINERIESNIALPGDIFRLGFKGNEEFIGKQIDLSSLRGDIKAYHEVGLGFSKNFTRKLRIGVKGKLLFGLASGSIDNNYLGITVNDDYSHTLDADLIVNISGPVNVYVNEEENNIDSIRFDKERFNSSRKVFDFLKNTRNMGLGLDIGAEYMINDRLIVSAAVTDLGYIKWKTDLTNLKAANYFDFSGLNMLDVINGDKTFEELGDEMLDSLKDSFHLTDEQQPFTTFLPVGVTLGGKYNLTEKFSFGLLSYSKIIGKQLREALTLSANLNLGNAFSSSISYTAANHRYDNLGAGLAFRAGVFQFYLLTDRIPVMWNRLTIDEDSFPLPASWNTVHIRFGMNLVFGNNIRRQQDKPMVLVE